MEQGYGYRLINEDPVFRKLKYSAGLYLNSVLNNAKRSHFVNGKQIDKNLDKTLTAYHETGHILMLWLSCLNVDINYSTIELDRVKSRRSKRKNTKPKNRFSYNDIKSYIEADPEHLKIYHFDSLVIYMGGIRAEQRRYGKDHLVQCKQDLHYVCIKAYKLALLLMEETGETDLLFIAMHLIGRALAICDSLLRRHLTQRKQLVNLLCSKKIVTPPEIEEIFGPRNIHGFSYWELHVIKDQIMYRAIYDRCTLHTPPTWIEASPEHKEPGNSPKVYLQL